MLFLDASADARTKIRTEIESAIPKLEKCFKNESGEFDKDFYEVNTPNMSVHLNNAGFHFEEPMSRTIGEALRCFGMMHT